MPEADAAAQPAPSLVPQSILYGRLKRRHKEYRPAYWEELRALYNGGHRLFDNERVMKKLFPAHNGEVPTVYKTRQERASYENYISTIVGHLVDGLFQDPVRLEYTQDPGAAEYEETEDGEEKKPPEPAPEKEDTFFDKFWKDASVPNGIEQSWNQILREQVKEAFQVGVAWTLLDTPDMGPDYAPETRADEEKSGATEAYAVPIRAEEVVNWKLDAARELSWALTMRCEPVIETIEDDGKLIRETYHLYTRNGWGRYVVEYHDEKDKPQGREYKPRPKDEDQIKLETSGSYDYGNKVPMLRLDFTDGLWALDLLMRNLKAHFNMTSGLNWAVDRANFPQLYEFLAPSLPGIDQAVNEHQEDTERATKQKRGPGHVQVRGKDDDAKYVSAPTESFDFTQTRLDRMRDEIYRQFLAMALSQDNSAASIRRTAESKAQDKASISVILKGIGDMLIALSRVTVQMLEKLRTEDCDASIVGFEKFDPIAIADSIEQNLVVDTMKVPSPTFHKARYKAFTRRFLHGDVDADTQKQIEEEIEANVTDEMFMPVPPLDPNQVDPNLKYKIDAEQGKKPPEDDAPKA